MSPLAAVAPQGIVQVALAAQQAPTVTQTVMALATTVGAMTLLKVQMEHGGHCVQSISARALVRDQSNKEGP